jgi:hypothetical protein
MTLGFKHRLLKVRLKSLRGNSIRVVPSYGTRLALRFSLPALPLTKEGCPISARFCQMWDSTNLGPWVYRVQMIVDMKTVASRE